MKNIKMGALYLNNTAMRNPMNPTANGDIPVFDGKSKITIKDAPKRSADKLITWNVVDGMDRWTPTGKLLIADRVLLVNVSWDDLARAGFVDGIPVMLEGRPYRVRIIPAGKNCIAKNVWSSAFAASSNKDEIWHWKGVSFWGLESGGGSYRHVTRGGITPCHREYVYSESREPAIGFRPALEMLNDLNEKTIMPTTLTGRLLCKTLNVKVNEDFEFRGKYYVLRRNGELLQRNESSFADVDMDTLMEIANHPFEVSPARIVTDEDKAAVDKMKQLFGLSWVREKSVKRLEDGSLHLLNSEDFYMELSSNLFPRLPAGMNYPLSDVA